MYEVFPVFHQLYIFNQYIYLAAGAPTNPIYIFRFNETKGAILSLYERTDYFKGVVEPIIFLNDYDWDSDTKNHTVVCDSIEKVVNRLIFLSGIKGEKEDGI